MELRKQVEHGAPAVLSVPVWDAVEGSSWSSEQQRAQALDSATVTPRSAASLPGGCSGSRRCHPADDLLARGVPSLLQRPDAARVSAVAPSRWDPRSWHMPCAHLFDGLSRTLSAWSVSGGGTPRSRVPGAPQPERLGGGSRAGGGGSGQGRRRVRGPRHWPQGLAAGRDPSGAPPRGCPSLSPGARSANKCSAVARTGSSLRGAAAQPCSSRTRGPRLRPP